MRTVRSRTPRAPNGNAGLIAAVHVAAKAHGLDDDTYRDKLEALTGKRSAKDLNAFQLRQVLDSINGSSKPTGRKPADTPVAKKARAMWLSLYALGAVSDPSESALRAWVKQQYKVDDLSFVPAADSFAVIEGLKRWAARPPYGVDWKHNKDPRRCVLAAQWNILVLAGAAPTTDISSHCYAVAGAASIAFATGPQLDKLINDLGTRVRAVRSTSTSGPKE